MAVITRPPPAVAMLAAAMPPLAPFDKTMPVLSTAARSVEMVACMKALRVVSGFPFVKAVQTSTTLAEASFITAEQNAKAFRVSC